MPNSQPLLCTSRLVAHRLTLLSCIVDSSFAPMIQCQYSRHDIAARLLLFNPFNVNFAYKLALSAHPTINGLRILSIKLPILGETSPLQRTTDTTSNDRLLDLTGLHMAVKVFLEKVVPACRLCLARVTPS